jgi:hypothetical protein
MERHRRKRTQNVAMDAELRRYKQKTGLGSTHHTCTSGRRSSMTLKPIRKRRTVYVCKLLAAMMASGEYSVSIVRGRKTGQSYGQGIDIMEIEIIRVEN